MNPYEKIKELSRLKKISIRELEKQLGYSNGYFSKWKSVSPNSDGLTKVADYFGVSVDYLLDREELKKPANLTVEEALASVMSSNGEPLADNDREILAAMFEAYIENSKK